MRRISRKKVLWLKQNQTELYEKAKCVAKLRGVWLFVLNGAWEGIKKSVAVIKKELHEKNS